MTLIIKMMTNKNEGYKSCAYARTPEEAKEKIRTLKWYYNPIDIYFMIKE